MPLAAGLGKQVHLLLQFGSLASDLCAFNRQVNLGFSQLFFPLLLEPLEILSFFSDDLVVIEDLAQRCRPHGNRTQVAALIFQQALQLLDFLVSRQSSCPSPG